MLTISATPGKSRPRPVYFAPVPDEPDGTLIAVALPDADDKLTQALRQAKALKARLVLVCDTADRAAEMARQAVAALPQHKRVSIEQAKADGWGLG